MKKIIIAPIALCLILMACNGENTEATTFKSVVTEITTIFDEETFPNPLHEELLNEINICQSIHKDSVVNGLFPCSSSFFKFYTYNHKRDLENAFLLQVRKGVSNYPYRRLLIFTRENGELVLMNGIRGYLVEKRSTAHEIDDLVVALIDNIGGHYERYDVLLKYENGKYHYSEALGDLEGVFDSEELKKEATKQIGQRIKEKELIF